MHDKETVACRLIFSVAVTAHGHRQMAGCLGVLSTPKYLALLVVTVKVLHHSQRRIQEPKKGGSACRSQHSVLLHARYATIVTYYRLLEKGGSVEPSEPPPGSATDSCLLRKNNKLAMATAKSTPKH